MSSRTLASRLRPRWAVGARGSGIGLGIRIAPNLIAALLVFAPFGAASAKSKSRHRRSSSSGSSSSPNAPSSSSPNVPSAPSSSSTALLPPPLTTAAAIRALSPEQAEQALPVLVHGVITCAGSLTFIQDRTAGIFVDVPVSKRDRYRVGQIGDLEGYTAPGLFAPQIIPRRFTVAGVMPLPPARPSKLDELSTGKLDSQRVELAGVIRAVLPDERPDLRRTVTLKMASDDGVFPVTVSDLPPERLRGIADAAVRVRGVVGGVFNERRQMVGIRLYVGQPDDLIVVEPGASDLGAVPTVPVERLLRFTPDGTSHHRMHVRGVVTLFHPGIALFVEDRTGGVSVHTRQMDALVVGDAVDVVGFPEMGSWTPVLEDAVFRRAGPASESVTPASVTADQELSAGAHDARLVRLDADLVDMVHDEGRILLVARDKNTVFDAELPHPADGSAPLVPPADWVNGSRMGLTGISVVRTGGDRGHPTGFRLLLRGLDDVAILARPSWWTLQRLIWIPAGLLAAVALALAWGVSLRRRVRAQTETIRHRAETESKLQARYQDLFENANDIIYTHDRGGRILTINRAGEAITGYTRAELLSKTIFDLALRERHEVLNSWLHKLAAGDVGASTFEWELMAKDGRLVPVEINLRPLGGAGGGDVDAVEGIARDISERRRAEAELGSSVKRLLETSRRGGVAEVATGVLRDVAHLTEQVAASVSELAAEQGLSAAGVARLAEDVERIRAMVAIQQDYARASGARVEVTAEALVEDALLISRPSIERRRIEVVREFSRAPVLTVDKQRVLEVLCQVLSNASHACAARTDDGATAAVAAAAGAGRITVRIETPNGDRARARVRIVVADNGVGIPHPNLGRIFDDGFTTWPDRRGAGLASASQAARELGGALFVFSDGAGKGARFTLDLPARPQPDDVVA